MRDHNKLKAFHLADALTLTIYRLTRNFPHDERFGLIRAYRRPCSS